MASKQKSHKVKYSQALTSLCKVIAFCGLRFVVCQIANEEAGDSCHVKFFDLYI